MPTDYQQAALSKALSQIDRAFGKPQVKSSRELAADFHTLAMTNLKSVINHRRGRWVRDPSITAPGVSRFRSIEGTPEALRMIGHCHAMARKFRAQARREEAAQAQLQHKDAA